MKKLILASASPRRKELLEQINVSFEVRVSDVEEIVEGLTRPEDVVVSLALQKAQDVAKYVPHDVVLGADTIVTYDGVILGKPKTKEEAYEMLQMLSGQTHEVFTGVAMLCGGEQISFFERTEVTFYELSDAEIHAYIESGEPMDKAGSYGIQGLGAMFVQKINGDYFSVVGLPIAKVYRELKEMGATSF
ncbi:Maf family protein [Priestia taiwanensis]|uniref:dTTP/UTP pyrophosphatase n=1 Tax=Priestia taiwanensis TaxID=1347902 RepID=A0A917AUL0_9BACI|nr:Maf family protein [Priestia taiwanensis]MBM7363602.1 septum formation protein [Priestia taiwanensis]GGE75714.1 septum formation protein Maf [Priestia taiwanensis]